MNRYVLPPDAKFRQYVFRFSEVRLLPLRHTIRSSVDLEKWADALKPISIYVSKACWLQAKMKTDGKAKDILLGGDLVVDIDVEKRGLPLFKDGKDGAVKEAIRVYDFLRTRVPHAGAWLVDSGRGAHLWLFGFWKPAGNTLMAANVKNRVNSYKAALLKVALMMRREGFVFCWASMTDPHHVFRVPGSVNHRNGAPVRILRGLDAPASRLDGCALPSRWEGPMVLLKGPDEKRPLLEEKTPRAGSKGK